MIFNNVITTELASSTFDTLFPAIDVATFYGEESVKAIFRFLLYGRNREATLEVTNSTRWNETVPEQNEVAIVMDRNFENIVDQMRKAAEENGFKAVEHMEYYLNQSLKALFYRNEETNSTFVAVDRCGNPAVHLLASTIPFMVPHLIDPKDITDEEKNVLRLMVSEDEHAAEKIESAFKDFIQKNRLKEIVFFEKIADIQKAAYKKQLYELKDKVNLYSSGIREKYAQLCELQDKYEKTAKEYQMRLAMPPAAYDEFADYLTHNKSVDIKNVHDGKIDFDVYTTIENFDEDAIETYINQPDSIWYENSKFSREKTEKLWRSIFIDRTHRVRTQARFCVSVHSSVIPYSECNENQKTYYPNPHLYHYNCLGGYSSLMFQAIQKGDMIEATELCISSAASLNMFDTTVTQTFVGEITGEWSDRKIIEDECGNLFTPEEVASM